MYNLLFGSVGPAYSLCKHSGASFHNVCVKQGLYTMRGLPGVNVTNEEELDLA